MKTLKFKSNINCDHCIAKVTETLDKIAGHDHWQVDITNPDKIVTLESDTLTMDQINEALGKLGYKVSEA